MVTAGRVALLVPDGGGSFAGASMPTTEALAAKGQRLQVQPTPEGLAPGTEVGFAALLGVALERAPSRGRVEAVAAGIDVGADEGAWRLDVLPAGDLSDADLERLDSAVAEVGGRVHRLADHRCLLVGPQWWGDAPPGPHQTDRKLREFAVGPFGGVAKAAKAALYRPNGRSEPPGAPRRIAWPWGILGGADDLPDVPATLRCPVTVVPASRAARGVALLTRCTVADEVPSDWDGVLVVHDARPDEAAHTKDPAAYLNAMEAFDAEVVAPIAQTDATVIVCADHGCDPTTGRHVAGPVDAVIGGAMAGLRIPQGIHGPPAPASTLLAGLLGVEVAA